MPKIPVRKNTARRTTAPAPAPAAGYYELLFAICASAYLVALLVIQLLTPKLAPVDVS